MIWDNEVTLISQTYAFDEIGNQIPTESEITVFCNVKSIGSNEFYNAATAGLKPALKFVIHNYEYDGQTLIEFNGNRYHVIRTYAVNSEEIELTCERVTTNES